MAAATLDRPRRSAHHAVRCAALSAALGATLVPAASWAEMRQVHLDGHFADWDGATPVWTDPTGDGGPSGIDLGAVWAADNDTHLFLRFEVGTDLVLQDDNDLTLYIDGDNDPATGFPVSGVGAELSWTFGSRSGFFFYGSDWTAIEWAAIGLVSGPTHSGDQFEVAIARDARPDGTHGLFTGGPIAIVLRDLAGGGDWAPNPGAAIGFRFDEGPLDPLALIDLESGASGALRMVTYNVLSDGLFVGYRQPSFARILGALDPDVIAFQEIYDHGAGETRAVIESWLGGSWSASQVSDKILLTRSTILDSWSIAGGRAGAFRISPRGVWEHDLLVINAHLSCCDNDGARQEQCDAIMAFVRDARTPGGELDLTADNPIVITGDMNFVGLSRQLTTLLTGDIADEGAYGPDFAPDWDETDLSDIVSRQPASGMGYTWYREVSDYSPGRLDFFIVTDSNAESAKNLILQTALMPPALLAAYGLESDDSDIASDHLPHFTDLVPYEGGAVDWPAPLVSAAELRLVSGNPVGQRCDLRLVLPLTGDATARVGRWIDGRAPTLSVQDVAGRVVRELAATRGELGVLHFRWDGRDGVGRSLPAGAYWIGFAVAQGGPVQRVLLVR